MIAKYPGDDDIQILHAIRLGLCAKLEQGNTTLEKATDLFNKFHEVIIKKKMDELDKGGDSI